MTDVGSPIEYVNISARSSGVIFFSLCFGIYFFLHWVIVIFSFDFIYAYVMVFVFASILFLIS